MGRGPIFREVGVNLIGGTSMLAIQLLITHDSKSCNCYTTAPLVINQPQLDWPRQENFSCKRIGEHKQERVNTKSEMADVYEAKTKMGVQALIIKGLITTVVKNKNGRPDSKQKDSTSQLQ
jgi:hypothetical protein